MRRTRAAFWILMFALGCVHRGAVEPPSVHVVNVTPLESTGFEQRLRVDLRVLNPNDFALEYDGLRFDLELNGQPFVRGLSDDEGTVPRLGDAVISVTATTTLFDLLRQIGSLAERSQGGAVVPEVSYRISGRLFLTGPGWRSVDFERTGTLGAPAARP